jgi:hypothetical protein
VARILIVGGGCRGLRMARALGGEGHAVRIVTRDERRRAQIEAAGAECFLGTPDRLLTLRPALEHVAVACWLLATAVGEPRAVAALHGSRLERFLASAVDTTVRGVVYEAGGTALPAEVLGGGERIVARLTARNAIPAAVLHADPRDFETWTAEVLEAVAALLEGSPGDFVGALS